MPAGERFEIRRSLGEGGFGVVFDAWDRKRGRQVALKQLREPDASALLRFKREFRSLADVSHPNLIRLEELFHFDGQWYFSMELVDGVDLLAWVRPPADAVTQYRFPFDEARLRQAFSQLAGGIIALHAADLLHRDLKPSNVLITREGRVVVLDFGLVTHLAPGDVTRTTQILGTPAYMSPEQVLGEELGPPSDWFSLGIMLYEALTGQLPFKGAFFAMMAARVEGEARSPSDILPGIPEDLDHLCRDLLRQEPGSRPDGAMVLARLGGTSTPDAAAPGKASVPAGAFFVGRREELAVLRDGLARARRGNPAMVEVTGLSGMGKSALVQHFLAEVREDAEALILSGRCYRRESVPYKALDSLVDGLSRWLLRLPPLEAARFLPRDFGALARLFPVLRGVGEATVGRRTTVEIPDAPELRRRGFVALRDLLGRLADDRTVVLAIDDLQWGDLDSGHLLLDLLQPPSAPPLLLVASFRSDEADHSPLLRLLRERRPLGVEVLTTEVRELAAAEAEALAVARLGLEGVDSAVAAKLLVRESGGSPFLMEQLAQQAATMDHVSASEGDDTLRLERVIARRLSGLDPESRRLLEVIAVAGRPIELQLANQAAGLDPREESAVGVLQAERWVRSRVGEGQDILETYHDRIRETVVGLLAEAVVPAYHNRIASALQASGVADPETLAEHYFSAGDLELAARHAVRAADLATEALAFDRAAKLYLMAIDKGRLEPAAAAMARVKLADALANAGRGAEAARAYLTAAAEAAPKEGLSLTRKAGEQFLISGMIQEGLDALRTVLGQVGIRFPASARRALVSLLIRRARLWVRGLKFTPRRASEIAPHRLVRMDTCWTGAIGLGLVEIIPAAHFQALHLELALAAGEPSRVARALILEMGFVATAGGRATRRVEALRLRCRALVEQVDQPYPRALLEAIEGSIANVTGRFADSHAHSVLAQRMLREHCTGVTWETEVAELYELHSLSHLGRWSELATRAPAILARARERRNNLLATYIRTRIQFLLHLAADDPARARAEQSESLAGWSGGGFQLQHYWHWYAQTMIDLYQGNLPLAWDRLAGQWRAYRLSLLSGTQALHIGILVVRARVAVGMAAREQGRVRARWVVRARRDLRWLDRTGMPWAVAQTGVVRAGLALLDDEPELAVRLLRESSVALADVELGADRAAAQWCLGTLDQSAAGQAARREAMDWMEREGIRNPARLAAMFVPELQPAGGAAAPNLPETP
ncbi:MAG: protein kinase [Gemmatimonadota bacterium]|nr:protein kinase [Gemmatimonadota bacterium]